ncbi:MAG TPA: AbrB/MazE/SpoVT family DNA-binding domain-containing protein [Candidatus Methanoperedens sp.]
MEIETEDIETVTMSTKGQVIIPARLRKKYGLKKGRKIVFMEENNCIKILPPTDLRSLCGSWPELDADALTKEIIEDRERDAQIDRERDAQIEKKVQNLRKKR